MAVPVSLIVIIVISIIIYFRLSPEKYSKMKSRLSNTKRSIRGAESNVQMENFPARTDVF